MEDPQDVSMAAVLADRFGVDLDQVTDEGFTAEFSPVRAEVAINWTCRVILPGADWLGLFQPAEPSDDRTMTVKQCAERYGVPVSRINSWRSRRAPYELINNRVVFSVQEMDAWVAREARLPGSDLTVPVE